MKKIYLDYAASTPVSLEVVKAMRPYWTTRFGNPGSLHSFGQEAMTAVDQSRERIARLLGAQFREIVFTSGATEANNLALQGAVKEWRSDHEGVPRIIVSTIEHESILEVARALEKSGVEVVYLPVDKEGVIEKAALLSALNEQTVIISIMHGNNEIGTIQPIREISEIIDQFRKKHNTSYPLLHTDAAQTFPYQAFQVNDLGVDYATFSGQKMYSTKGVGVLFVRGLSKESSLQPIAFGGGQEFGLRPGTENVPLIVGLAEAMELAERKREKEFARVAELKNYLISLLRGVHKSITINGPKDDRGLPHILNANFPGVSAADLLVYLDLQGVAVSTGSACRARSPEPSHVLKAIGLSTAKILTSIRFSFGRETTKAELDTVAAYIKNGFYKKRKR